ncbi:alpha/beta fold hydrolase [Rhodococcus erythropolis]|uniref:alpha/beta fold hydrolase n=1 Tax=Rhodococcus erythropolis TaxID=1833 RepID=UPI0024B6A409|nr:alpha/beta hydrolase [Rhodococcus erythropolis]MDJ0016550.1 alpha/beta hydrolase [Rhodococcus erythropolis]
MNTTLGYTIQDADNGPVVCYLHGAILGSTMWHAQRDMPGQRQLMIDLPGIGRSRNLKWKSMRDTADQVAKIIAQRVPDGCCHVVGISLGGDLAVELLASHPERVRSAVVSGLILRPMTFRESWPGWSSIKNLRSRTFLGQLADYNRLPNPEREELLATARYLRRSDYARVLRDIYGGFDVQRLRNLDTPVLAIAGENEPSIARDAVETLCTMMSNADPLIAPAVGHSWNSEDPDYFARVLTDWIDRHND